MCQLDGEFWQHKKWNNRYKNFKIIRLSKNSVPIDRISINNALFVHLKEGRLSTAKGMTIEYAKEMMSNLAER